MYASLRNAELVRKEEALYLRFFTDELKIRKLRISCCETISYTDANFLNLHIDKATKTRGDKQLYLITQFTKATLNLNYLLLTLNVTEQFLKNPKQKRPFFF